ncbi:hypothetical protein TRFO_41037 [Tritrichomonas foetus]|uniref:Protein kinase domain-containing protein n=1 Tax=Tritrichomonas foetus TaxID=1144522 RepID=A0A1J4L608_9EUKA|nr:hypothetical protein TRFO_41037 [Tritrichomonas foetus]|eukprot:OHT17382.1 hypothetical protein TRFO_41037 [Tritrichomonas foetus]
MATVAGKFKIDREIGRGSYATVYSATLIQPYPPLEVGSRVAIKSISTSRISSAQEKEKLENEISLMKSLNHPHIVKLYGVERLRSYYFLVMEYCNDGDLIHFLHSNGKGLDESVVIDFMAQIGSGLSYLHHHQIVHRDLKPHNILISKSDEGQHSLKIADFGFARFLRPSDLAETICGSPIYMAPEIQFGSHYSAQVDMWSLGVIIFELITTKTPFPNIKSQYELAQELKNRGSQPYCLPVSAQVSQELRTIVKQLLTIDSEKRMNLNEFLSSPIFDEFRETTLKDTDYEIPQNYNQDIVNETQTQIQVPDQILTENGNPKNEVSENENGNENLNSENLSQNNAKESIDFGQKSERNENISRNTFSFTKSEAITRDFSFIMSAESLSIEHIEPFIANALEAANTICNFASNIDGYKGQFQILTIVCAFIIDFLAEYKLVANKSLHLLNYTHDSDNNDGINEDLVQKIMDFLDRKVDEANDLQNEIKNDDTIGINATQYLYDKGVEYARQGAELEKRSSGGESGPLTMALFHYKKALSALMPVCYRSQTDEFTGFVRELYMKITRRTKDIEKRLSKI